MMGDDDLVARLDAWHATWTENGHGTGEAEAIAAAWPTLRARLVEAEELLDAAEKALEDADRWANVIPRTTHDALHALLARLRDRREGAK